MRESPHILYVDVHGYGDPVAVARAVRAALMVSVEVNPADRCHWRPPPLASESSAVQSLDSTAVALVAAGGAAGCVLRYLVVVATQGTPGAFPWGTLAVNVAGSLLLGAVLGALPTDNAGRLLFGTGFCGGFTTFSTFSAETVALVAHGQLGRASAYVASSVTLSFLAVAAGIAAGRAVAGRQ